MVFFFFLWGSSVFVFCRNLFVCLFVQIFIQGMSREGSLSWDLGHTPWEDALP